LEVIENKERYAKSGRTNRNGMRITGRNLLVIMALEVLSNNGRDGIMKQSDWDTLSDRAKEIYIYNLFYNKPEPEDVMLVETGIIDELIDRALKER
jgi:hypothetical protein